MEGADDATWAPQSPKFDGYKEEATEEFVHPQHRGYRGSISHSLPYSPPASSPTLQSKSLPPPPPVATFAPEFKASPPPSLFDIRYIGAVGMPRGVKKEESMQDADYIPESDVPVTVTEKTRGKGVKKEEGNGAVESAAGDVNITVHFPVARIKRIMQADDDVGKVAQVTPVCVSKALELFMVSLVTKSAAEAKARNSKRVGAIHLKQAIANDPQFDFLSDIVAKVADAPTAAEKSEDAMDVDGGKKKKTSSRRKKKTDDDDF